MSLLGIDLLNSLAMPGNAVDRNGKRVLQLAGGNILKVACLATMTSGKTLTVFAQAEEF